MSTPSGGRQVQKAANTKIAAEATDIAPDGSEVRVLLDLHDGGMAHFSIAPNETSVAVFHKSVEEIWYIIEGRGEMWIRSVAGELFVDLEPGICVTIPLGSRFQFRSVGDNRLAVVAVTMPPWPNDRIEAVRSDVQKWTPTLMAGPNLGEPTGEEE